MYEVVDVCYIKNFYLVVIVKFRVNNIKIWEVIRKIWGNLMIYSGVVVIFFLG